MTHDPDMTATNPTLCDRDRSLLVMVDMQEKLLGAMSADDRVHVLRQGKLLLRAASQLGVPVIATEQYPQGLGPTDAGLRETLPDTGRIFDKTCFSCCGADGFTTALDANRPQVILFGIEAHVCLLQTALELQTLGKQVFVAEDAICSRNDAHKHNAVARMRQAGIIVTNSESVLFEWLRDARHEQFRTLSALLKNG